MTEYFPAFTHRNFKLFWFGQIISLTGTWMQNTALNWLVYSITNDRFLVGLMSAVQFLPLLFFSLSAGILVEKYPKRKILIFTQSIQLIAASVLFILLYFNKLTYPAILSILFCIGMIQVIDNPARQSFVVEMVDGRNHLLNAIALNSAAFNGARLIGPAFAGKIMADLGTRWCFFLNTISFVAVLIGLLMMNIEDKPSRKKINNPSKDIIEGLIYIKNTPKLLYTIISVMIIPTFCINFNILIPIFTRDVLHLKEKAFGMLLSSLGFGALIGAISVAANAKKEKSMAYQLLGSFGLCISMIILGFTKNYTFALIILSICGFFMIMYTTTSNSVMQLNSPENMRGRIISVYMLVFGGFTPIGSIYSGVVSKYLGSENTFKISGLIGLIGFLILFLNRKKMKI